MAWKRTGHRSKCSKEPEDAQNYLDTQNMRLLEYINRSAGI